MPFNGFIFDLWALAFAAIVAGIAGLIVLTSHRRGPKPYDWETQGECDNASKPRVIDMTRRLK